MSDRDLERSEEVRVAVGVHREADYLDSVPFRLSRRQFVSPCEMVFGAGGQKFDVQSGLAGQRREVEKQSLSPAYRAVFGQSRRDKRHFQVLFSGIVAAVFVHRVFLCRLCNRKTKSSPLSLRENQSSGEEPYAIAVRDAREYRVDTRMEPNRDA